VRVPVLLEKCSVLRQLADRADKTFYLTHQERTVLLCTLGHLGDEGRAALHEIIGKCHNYRRETTDRYIAKMPASPISCARMRERLPQVTATADCNCLFRLRGRAYPTPILHVLKPSEIPVFRKEVPKTPSRTPSAPNAPSKTPPGDAAPGAGHVNARTGAAPAPGAGHVNARTSAAPEPPTPSARLAPVPARPPPVPAVLDEAGRTRAEAILRRVAELKGQMRRVRTSMEQARSELGAMFEAAGAEALELALGTLRRVRREEGEGWEYHLEV